MIVHIAFNTTYFSGMKTRNEMMNAWIIEVNFALQDLMKISDRITREARRKWLEKLRHDLAFLRDGIR